MKRLVGWIKALSMVVQPTKGKGTGSSCLACHVDGGLKRNSQAGTPRYGSQGDPFRS